ncbi:MAG: hypothetical protein MUO77_08820 [Anaerolineales bacterium]|nr:hypothetical protein [Anaerolineales bacterium]
MRNRTQLVLGIVLILLGSWLVATKQIPQLGLWWSHNYVWPMWVVGAGALILIMGMLLGAPGMAVPACIVAGVGGILYYQNSTNDFSSWSYLWTLIPGFVGVGSILAGLLGDNTRYNLSRGINALVTSAVLFLVFASLLGGLNLLGSYGLPVILILLGVYIIARGLFRNKERI